MMNTGLQSFIFSWFGGIEAMLGCSSTRSSDLLQLSDSSGDTDSYRVSDASGTLDSASKPDAALSDSSGASDSAAESASGLVVVTENGEQVNLNDYRPASLKSRITEIQPMTGVVFWPDQAKHHHATLENRFHSNSPIAFQAK